MPKEVWEACLSFTELWNPKQVHSGLMEGKFWFFFFFFSFSEGLLLKRNREWIFKIMKTKDFKIVVIIIKGLPQWLRGKESTCNAGAMRDVGLIPGSGRSPGGGHGNSLQCSCLENPVDRGAWGASVYSISKSWTCLNAHT